MARSWRFWRAADDRSSVETIAARFSVSVGGSVGGDLVVGDNNVLMHIHEAPEKESLRLRVVDARPAAAVDLQDRPDALSRLAAMTAGATTYVLAGRRGVGKSQLAAQYSRLRDDEGWEVVVWLPAESETAIIAGWAQLAAQIDASAPADPATAARSAITWLDAQPARALIVYDNAVDPDVVTRWRPTGDRAEIVVTTNHREFRGLGVLIDVDVFGEDQAAGYLAARSGLTDPDGAALLATDLGCLPLALAQAGALIGTDRRYRTFEAYRKRLAQVDVATMLPRTPGDPYPQGLAEATLVAITELDNQHRLPLEVLAMLSPDGVDSALLAPLSPGDPDAVEDRLQDLVDRSLISRSEDGEHVLMHRMIQRVVRDAAPTADYTRAVVQLVATVLGASLSYEPQQQMPMQYRFWNLGNQIMTLLANTMLKLGPDHGLDPALVVTLIAHLGWFAWHLNEVGDVLRAIQLGEHVLAEKASILDPDDPDLILTRNNLAIAYDAAGQMDEAVALYEYNLEETRRIYGPDDVRSISFRSILARAYRSVGRLEEALSHTLDALADSVRINGPEHMLTLHLNTELGNELVEVGRLDEAVSLLDRNLADQLRILGPDHLSIATSRSGLAHAYQAAERLDLAIPQYEASVADMERIFGADSIRTLNALNDLATAYLADGQADVAIPLFNAVVSRRMEVLGPDHVSVVTAGANLGYALRLGGYFDDAITTFEEVLEHAQEILGEEDPTTIMVATALQAARKEQAETS